MCIWGAGGATPGKFLVGLRVVTCDTSVLVQPNRVLVVPATNVSLSAWVVNLKGLLIVVYPVCLSCFYHNHCLCLPLQINCSSLEQELFYCLLFPSLHHTSVLPTQQDCVWYGSWNNCCQALQGQMMQKTPEDSPTMMLSRHRVMLLFNTPAGLRHRPFKVSSEHTGELRWLQRVWYTSLWTNQFPTAWVLLGTYCIFVCTCCVVFILVPNWSLPWRQEN